MIQANNKTANPFINFMVAVVEFSYYYSNIMPLIDGEYFINRLHRLYFLSLTFVPVSLKYPTYLTLESLSIPIPDE